MEEIKRIREVAKYLERSSAIDIADELNQCCDLLEKKVKAFEIIKKKKGNLICNEYICDKCPLQPLKCNMVDLGDSLYDGLDKIKEHRGLDDRVYSLFKEILDEELEE